MNQLKTKNLFDEHRRTMRRNSVDLLLERLQNMQQCKIDLFNLYFTRGLTQEEIGNLLDVPHTTVGYRLRRILRELNGTVRYNSSWRKRNGT